MLVLVTLVLALTAALSAHDLFFRATTYRVAPGSEVVVDVLNGTFSRSDNAVTRDRLASFTLVSPAGRVELEPTRWSETEPKSQATVALEAPGTHVLGAAIKPRLLSLPGAEFNAYLKEEGLDDVLARRKAQGRLAEASKERYSKYVKAILQVGATPTDTYATALGHAAEILLEDNPERLTPGSRVRVRCLVDGRPWAGKTVFAGGRRGTTDRRLPQQRLVTDADGRVVVEIREAGVWYVKFVAMVEVNEAEANYESKWATLSFGIYWVDAAANPR
jgi:uncharacterized GH25 family protein